MPDVKRPMHGGREKDGLAARAARLVVASFYGDCGTTAGMKKAVFKEPLTRKKGCNNHVGIAGKKCAQVVCLADVPGVYGLGRRLVRHAGQNPARDPHRYGDTTKPLSGIRRQIRKAPWAGNGSRGLAEGLRWSPVPRHPVTRKYLAPQDSIGWLADIMESIAAAKELMFALGAGLYLLWDRWRRLKEDEEREAVRLQKEHLDSFLQQTLRIEAEQMDTTNPEALERFLDDITKLKLQALERLTHEHLRGDRIFSIFLMQCANLISKIQLKIVTYGSNPPISLDDSRRPHRDRGSYCRNSATGIYTIQHLVDDSPCRSAIEVPAASPSARSGPASP
jgi:hypothetical protein